MTVINLREQLEKRRVSEEAIRRIENERNLAKQSEMVKTLAPDFNKQEEEKSAHSHVREGLRKETNFPVANGVSVKQKYQDRTNRAAAARMKQQPKLNKPIFSADDKTSASVSENEDAQNALRNDPQLRLGSKPSPGCGKSPTPQPH